MDEKLSKLKEKISEIDGLKTCPNWGPEFQLWKRVTDKLVQETFGKEGLDLFSQQMTRTTSYIDPGFNRSQYLKELENRRKILNGLLAELKEHEPQTPTAQGSQKDVLKEIWSKEEALRANLLSTQEAQVLQQSLFSHLDGALLPTSIPGLRFKKLRAEKRYEQWWSDKNGYPTDSSWEKIKPFLEIFQQHEAEKTIKHRLETEGLFVESRSQGEDQHLLIGEKNGSGDKAHVIIDGKTGEIRVEDNQQEPTDVVTRIEAILTLPSGKKIRTTREAIEEIPAASSPTVVPMKKPIIDFTNGFSHMSNSQGRKIIFQLVNSGDASAYDIEINITSDEEALIEKERSPFRVASLLPTAISGSLEMTYSHLNVAKTKLSNPRIAFTYKDADGHRFESSRALHQDLRADNEFNINPSDFLGIKQLGSGNV